MKHLMLFAQRPVPGRVLRRLSPAFPAAFAYELYRILLDEKIRAVYMTKMHWAADRWRVLWEDDERGEGTEAELQPGDVTRIPPSVVSARRVRVPAKAAQARQVGRNLGERLENAFGEVFRGEVPDLMPEQEREKVRLAANRLLPTRAIVIDVNALGIGFMDIFMALRTLDHDADVVLGPTRDGGYAMIGLGQMEPSLFHDIDWGTSRVLEQTLDRARAKNLRVELLPVLGRLESATDLLRLIAGMAQIPPGSYPGRLREALQRLDLLPATWRVRRATAVP